MGCAVKSCKGLGFYVVCEYWPRGNVGFSGRDEDRFYREMVQGQVEGEEGDTAVGSVGGVGTASVGGDATGTGESPAESSKSEGSGRYV